MKEKINISKHTLMRFASKVYKNQITNEKTFEEWKKSNEDKLEDLEKDLRNEYQQSKYISTSSYDNLEKVDFFINKEAMMTFLVNENEIITCYPIDFELDHDGNVSILNVLLENLERAKEAEANFEEDHFYTKENLNRELEVVLAEMDSLNSKLKTLNEKKAVIEAKKAELIAEHSELKTLKKVAEEKIIKSKLAF